MKTALSRVALGAGLIWGACALVAVQAASADAPSQVEGVEAWLLPPDGHVEGEGFGALTARWWQWAERLPIAPYLDPDGRLCELGQQGPVWFLAGTDGSFNARRECVVPADRHILVPIINMRYSSRARAGSKASACRELQTGAAVNNERLASAIVLIDGEPVPHVARYRVRSEGCFPLDADDAASPLTAADGYWLLLKPLPTGRHTLTIGANYDAGDRGYGRMVQNFEYVLHVGGRASLAMR